MSRSKNLSMNRMAFDMSRIRSKDTKPEILVRKGLHARGFRFRLQDRRLPGRPDIVLPKWGVVIMVNGCFWHGHKGCRYASRPKSNIEYWLPKIERNIHRDEVTSAHLEALGWKVLTVWECELRRDLDVRLDALAEDVRMAGRMRMEQDSIMRRNRKEYKEMRDSLLARQALLEAEISAMYRIPSGVRKESLDLLD
ncbi:MAG: DNA mismatch endonuclease Vsr [Bacteroidales bacterium]|nr:DNA mismatch endonuclease Vsr [Bacteroidales bacterium]